MSSIKICSLILLQVYISTAARAPDSSDQVNFTGTANQPLLPCHPFCGSINSINSINTAPAEPRGGRERILPNKCTFDVEVCKSKRNRQAPLLLSHDQSNIVYPSTGGK